MAVDKLVGYKLVGYKVAGREAGQSTRASALQLLADARTQVGALRSLLLLTYGPALLVLAGAAVAYEVRGIPTGYLTRDPAALAQAPFYIGAISNLGMLGWSAGAAACALAYALLRRDGGPSESRRFFLASGLLTAVLLVDDLFLVHDQIAPRYFRVPEEAILAVYAACAAAYLARFGAAIRGTDFLPLALALGFFAASLAADLWLAASPYSHLVEDGCKLIGIASWSAYFTHTALQQLQARRARGPAGVAGPATAP